MRHIGAPDDSRGIHFDLLLEDKKFCRTWRLIDIPLVDGPQVNCLHISPHKLEWLNIKEKIISGNRGVATRIKKGIFWNDLPSNEKNLINFSLTWEGDEVDLLIVENYCRIISKRSNYCL